MFIVAYRVGHQFPSILILEKVSECRSHTLTLMSGLDPCNSRWVEKLANAMQLYFRKMRRDDAAFRREKKYDHFRSACWGAATFFFVVQHGVVLVFNV